MTTKQVKNIVREYAKPRQPCESKVPKKQGLKSAKLASQEDGSVSRIYNEDSLYGKYYRLIKVVNPATKRLNHRLVCMLCDKISSGRIYDMQEHIRSHLKLKPFKCQLCGLAFNKKSNRTRHIGKSNCLRRMQQGVKGCKLAQKC